jgi:hypothetical protein
MPWPERLRSIFAVALAAGAAVAAAQQSPHGPPPAKPSRTLRLEGTWANNTVTPFERPDVLGDKRSLSDGELAVLKARAERLFSGDGDYASGDDLFLTLLANPAAHKSRIPVGEYNQVWANDGLVFEHATSQIVDPLNGKLPPFTPDGERKQAALAERMRLHPADGPEDRNASERCLTFGTARVGFLQSRNNSYYQIVQTPKYVVITSEMIHEARIVPLTDRPHADSTMRFWSGDARGRWDGATLVIDTTNFRDDLVLRPRVSLFVSGEHLHLVERLTPIDDDTLRYQATVDDPTWTQPWTAVTTWTRTSKPMFEYACHEGNYAMADILAGARAAERDRKH